MKWLPAISLLVAQQAFAITAMEWESAVPIEDLIDEDSGSVKFYLNNPEQNVEASEKIPQGYLPKSESQRIELLYNGGRAQTQGTETGGMDRAPAHVDEMKASVDRLKAIENKLMTRNPQNQGAEKEEPSFWGELGSGIQGTAEGAYDKAKDGFGQVYRGIFSAPPDLVFGESVHDVAIIQSASGYVPQKIPLARGVKTRLYISGTPDRKLAFVSDPFNIQRSIKGNQGVTVIEFTPDSAGMYRFYDPINKIEGWFLVR